MGTGMGGPWGYRGGGKLGRGPGLVFSLLCLSRPQGFASFVALRIAPALASEPDHAAVLVFIFKVQFQKEEKQI